MRKREQGNEDENDVEDYKWNCEIWGSTCVIRFGIPNIGVIRHQIRTCTCAIRDSTLTRTRNSCKSQFLIMISPVPSHLLSFLSSILPSPYNTKLSHRSLSISPCHDQELQPCTAYTKYSIHQVQHTVRIVHTE